MLQTKEQRFCQISLCFLSDLNAIKNWVLQNQPQKKIIFYCLCFPYYPQFTGKRKSAVQTFSIYPCCSQRASVQSWKWAVLFLLFLFFLAVLIPMLRSSCWEPDRGQLCSDSCVWVLLGQDCITLAVAQGSNWHMLGPLRWTLLHKNYSCVTEIPSSLCNSSEHMSLIWLCYLI